MSKRLTGLNPLAYMGVEPLTPANTYNQMTDPTVNDFQGFNLGDIWVNKVGIRVWIYLGQDNSRNAIWLELAASGTVGASDFITDSGTAVTNVSGQINVIGGSNINTSGAGDTVTINLDNNVTISGNFVTTAGNISLANTNSAGTEGIINFGGSSFINNYGDDNVFIGKNAGNTTLTVINASDNVAIGFSALNATVTAGENVAIGSDSQLSNVSGDFNCSVGDSSLRDLTTGLRNASYGALSLQQMLTGSDNSAYGYGSGQNYNGSESNNIVIKNDGVVGDNHIIRLGTTGSGQGQQTTCYLAGNVHVDEGNLVLATTNTGPTVGVIYSNTDTLLHTYGSFSNNIFLGINAGNLSNVTQDNIAIGSLAGADIATGTGNNIMIGSSAGTNLTTGNHNVIIGAGAGTNYVSTESDNILIGSVTGTIGEQDVIRIGNAQTTCFIAGIRGVTTTNNDAVAVLVDSAGQLGTVSSSRVYKENIVDMRAQSEGIMSLRPVTFNYKKDERKAKHYGLIAEEVAETMPDLVVYNAEGTSERLNTILLVPLLLNEVQRMNERILELEDKNCRN